MKKYIIDITSEEITQIQDINTLKRTNNSVTGVLINERAYQIDAWNSAGRDFAIYKYNNPTLYLLNRKIDILPESKIGNTIITNDGLIGVVYPIGDNYFITIVDIFEQDTLTYDLITLNDFDLVDLFTEEDNPFNKRIFLCTGAGGETGSILSTKNRKIYEKDDSTYFESDMDYNLPREVELNGTETEGYGYYKVDNVLWNSDYENVNIFQFYKKQFFRIIGPADLEVELDSGQTNITMSYNNNNKILELRYLEIDNEDKFVRLKFSSTSTYCYVIVY